MITPEEVFLIGRLTRTHGIYGEMELQFTDDAFDRGSSPYLVLLIDGIFVPFFFEQYRFKNNEYALIQWEDITSEVQARNLVGLSVYYPHAHLVQNNPEDALPTSLQGFTGYQILIPSSEDDISSQSMSTTLNGESQIATQLLGTVVHVHTTPSTALFTLQTDQDEELLIPFHYDFLLHCDPQQRILLLQLPDGILELNAN